MAATNSQPNERQTTALDNYKNFGSMDTSVNVLITSKYKQI